MLFFKSPVNFSLNIASPFSVVTQLLCNFLAQTLYTLDKKVSQITNFKTFECSSEVQQIPDVIYENTSHFAFKVCIYLQYNDA